MIYFKKVADFAKDWFKKIVYYTVSADRYFWFKININNLILHKEHSLK